MGYYIQCIDDGKYLKHDGNDNIMYYPYVHIENIDNATVWNDFEHAKYVSFWYADMHKDWRVVDEEGNVLHETIRKERRIEE